MGAAHETALPSRTTFASLVENPYINRVIFKKKIIVIKADVSGFFYNNALGFVWTVRPNFWPDGLGIGLPVRISPRAFWQQTSPERVSIAYVIWWNEWTPNVSFILHHHNTATNKWSSIVPSWIMSYYAYCSDLIDFHGETLSFHLISTANHTTGFVMWHIF